MILIDLFSIIFLNSIKYKDIPTPDYALAYATIKLFNITPKDKEKIKKMDMNKKIRQTIYEALRIATYQFL